MAHTHFQLSEQDLKKFNEWRDTLYPKGDPYSGAIGGQYTFTFTPTSLGTVITVIDSHSKKELNLTDYDSW